jgi:hypothetical protein
MFYEVIPNMYHNSDNITTIVKREDTVIIHMKDGNILEYRYEELTIQFKNFINNI